jgi:death-on-curing protein
LTQYLELEVFVLEFEAVGYRVKDYGLLGAALARPKTSAFGKEAYGTLELKAATLVHSLIQNHPMFDGNKRVAWLGLNAFLYLNACTLQCEDTDAYVFISGIAQNKFSVDEIASWIKHHSVF